MPVIRNATCHRCGQDIPAGQPVYRKEVRTGEHTWKSNGASYPVSVKVSFCEPCWTRENPYRWQGFGTGLKNKLDEGQWDEMRKWYPGVIEGQPYSRCEGCGRLLGRACYWPSRSCSRECMRDARNERRRKPGETRTCARCSTEFVPPRADARYCSGACRQAAYRNRHGLGFHLRFGF